MYANTLRAGENRQSNLDHAHGLGSCNDQGPNQRIVASQKGEQSNCDCHGLDQGDGDAEQKAQVPAAVHAGGVEECGRQGQEGLPHQKDREGAGGPWHDEGGVGVVPSETADEHEVWYEGNFQWDHHCGEHDGEEHAPAGKTKTCKGIARGKGRNDNGAGDGECNKERIEDRQTENN